MTASKPPSTRGHHHFINRISVSSTFPPSSILGIRHYSSSLLPHYEAVLRLAYHPFAIYSQILPLYLSFDETHTSSPRLFHALSGSQFLSWDTLVGLHISKTPLLKYDTPTPLKLSFIKQPFTMNHVALVNVLTDTTAQCSHQYAQACFRILVLYQTLYHPQTHDDIWQHCRPIAHLDEEKSLK
jgi:hypothetical protein